MNQFMLVPCPKCGNQVHVAPAAGIGYCPKCMSQVPIPPGGAPMASFGAPGGAPGMPAQPGYGAPPGGAPGMPAQPGYGAPAGGAPGMPAQPGYGGPGYGPPPAGMPGAPGAPGMGAYGMPGGFGAMGGAKKPPVAAIFGSVALAVVASVGYGVFRAVIRPSRPGHVSLSSVGIDEKTADPDKMIAAVRPLAKKWRADAELYSINILGLRTTGTVDLSEGGSVVTIEYFSPAAVSSPSTTVRKDSIKKFIFNSAGVDYSAIWGVRERQSNVAPTPVPSCTAKQVAAALAGKGLKAGKTAHLNLDPTFSFATKELSWHAMADEPKLDAWYSIATCAVTK